MPGDSCDEKAQRLMASQYFYQNIRYCTANLRSFRSPWSSDLPSLVYELFLLPQFPLQNATQILKVAGFDKPQRTRVLEREVQKGTHEKIQGGYGKYQGVYLSLSPPPKDVALPVVSTMEACLVEVAIPHHTFALIDALVWCSIADSLSQRNLGPSG
jgi:hypothetical protein